LVMFHGNTAAGIGLGSFNTGSLRVSAGEYYRVRGGDAPLGDTPCILAGFSSALNSGSNNGASALSTFTGLAVTGTAGALQEYVNGAAAGEPVAFVGTYKADDETILSYTIDTATGAISDVTFGHSRATYFFPTPQSFSRDYTANVEIGGNTGGSRFAVISSFILGPAPAANTNPDGKQASQ